MLIDHGKEFTNGFRDMALFLELNSVVIAPGIDPYYCLTSLTGLDS